MSKAFSERLTSLRKERYQSQKDGAAALGVSISRYNKWETDTNSPDYDTVCRIADHYGVTTDYLLGRTDIRVPVSEFDGDEFENALHNAIMNLFDSFILRYREYKKLPNSVNLDNEFYAVLVSVVQRHLRVHDRLITSFQKYTDKPEQINKAVSDYIDTISSLGIPSLLAEVDDNGVYIDGIDSWVVFLDIVKKVEAKIPSYSEYRKTSEGSKPMYFKNGPI